MLRKSVLLILVIASLLMAACTGPGFPGMGILKGDVTIGPLQPLQRPGVQSPVPPEVYAARKVMIYDQSGKKLLWQVDIDSNGHYAVIIAPNTYTIDINHIGIDRSPQVPRQVVVKADETVTLDIDIDTGIR